jgi:hypothetical protein
MGVFLGGLRPPFMPAPIPGHNSDLLPDDDFAPTSSGFELGVRFVSTPRGIRVKPDSAADGVLFVNDIITAAAYRDDNGRKRRLLARTQGPAVMLPGVGGGNGGGGDAAELFNDR